MQILNNPISALNVCETLKFSRRKGNRGWETRWWRQIFHRKGSGSGNMAGSRMRNASGNNYWNSSFILTWLWGRYHVPQNAFLVPSMFSLLVWEKAIYDGTRRLSHFAQSSLHSTDTGYNFQFQPQSARTTHSCVPEWKPFTKQNICIFVVLKGCFFHRRSQGVQRGEVHPQC